MTALDGIPVAQLRASLITAIADVACTQSDVLALWEAGSASFGRLDEWSDIDLQVVVRDDTASAVFSHVEAAIASVAPIELAWHVPEPAWHGSSQRFYRLIGAPATLLLDITIAEASNPKKFLEPEQHGRPDVLYDPDGITMPPAFNAASLRERMRIDLQQAKVRVAMFHVFVEKELRRGRNLDALGFYRRLVLDQLIMVLGMVYRPLTYDFAMRYLHEDLPATAAGRLQRLAFVGSPDQLEDVCDEATQWFQELVDGLNIDAIPLEEIARDVRTVQGI